MTLVTEKNDHDHRVLIVGDLPGQTRDLDPILDRMKIQFIHVKTGEQGLKAIGEEPSPFSLVICDQRLNGMKGTAFLAELKEMAPETIRFLITGYSDMDTIISAVNKGAVHRYISKPWNEDQMTEVIRSGITRYEYHLESDRLLVLAKTQNAKLFELNCELMETAKLHDKESKILETNIAAIAAQLKEKTARRPLTPMKSLSLILKTLQGENAERGALLNAIYSQTITELYETFNELALRNGIEMPAPEQAGSGTGESNG